MAKKDPTAPIEGIEIRHRQGCKARNLGGGCVCSPGVRTTTPQKMAFNGSDPLADRVEAARRWRSDALRMIANGVPLTQSHRVTFDMAVAEWLRYVENVKRVEPATIKDYKRVAPLLVSHFGANTLVQRITPQTVEGFRDKLAQDGRSARTINRQLVILGGVFRRMKGKWSIDHNPAHGSVVERVKESKANGGLLLFYTPEEVQALVRAYVRHGELWGLETQVYADMALTAAMTGLRAGELLGLRFSDVDLAGSRILVSRSYCQVLRDEKAPKSGQVRSIPLADEVAQVIARQEGGGSDLVFRNADKRIDYGRWNHLHKRAVAQAGVPYRSIHKLRHTFGTQMAAHGAPLTTIQAWMGHAHISTTMIYAHYAPKRNEADMVSAAFAVEQRAPEVAAVA